MEQSSCEVGGQKANISCLNKKSSELEQHPISDAVGDDSREFVIADCEHIEGEEKASAAHHRDSESAPVAKHNLQKSRKRKISPQTVEPRRYVLRSSLPKENNKTSTEQSTSTSNPIIKRGRKKRKGKNVLNDEVALIRKRIRYLFNRINYEQSLIDAYSSEGWKGLSLEKIRPEKELERAKSEILRRKLRIRESFHQLESLLSVGRLEENLFDDDEIDSENIFCAKCGSKDSSLDNDIILCDGSCNRAFHQKCLNPPLLTHEIPPGDQGWLCPACDCKEDCLQLLNEFQGSNLSIEDSWEKVFPEAAAIANGNKQLDESNYPSDDSDDDDYDPDAPEVNHEDQEEGSSSHELCSEESSEESDSTSLSEDLVPPKYNNFDVLGLPSDDSEDDDYDPECLNPNKDVEDKGLESDESDFTSDSDEFCAELSKTRNTDEVTSSSLLDTKRAECSGEGSNVAHKDPINAELPPIVKADLGLENICPMSKRRQQERLDYKKLYNEAYAKASSDSSEDEDWNEKGKTNKVKKDNNRKEYPILPYETTLTNQRSSNVEGTVYSDQLHVSRPPNESSPNRAYQYIGAQHANYQSPGANGSGKEYPILPDATTLTNQRSSSIEGIVHADQSQVSRASKESTPNRTHQYLGVQYVNDQSPGANGNKATSSVRRHFGQNVTQKLHEIFKEIQYPSRELRENLAEELGLTLKQIDKWFEKSRSNMRNSTMGSNLLETPATASPRETNLPGTAFPDNQHSLNKSNRKNNNSSKGNSNSVAANKSNDKTLSKANNGRNQVGNIIHDNDKLKRTLEIDRQKAVERELRKMRKKK
ncbi:homeobox protein HOX1A [Canna indica]|uniref:Homeobox protein HOX1A n=1 Tax=Canna indica TaxID=4628 RepID=A0AAQ3QQA7_9LILI|nr:homeobox protein HOX1A [Canna indica]